MGSIRRRQGRTERRHGWAEPRSDGPEMFTIFKRGDAVYG